ncbi:MAG TPA: T9SS type A sorting domain-containing protein [Bacteroidetes bacterium]|nr:T9SS type A sorting domain-containing protein [Bacteroidota bacterium]
MPMGCVSHRHFYYKAMKKNILIFLLFTCSFQLAAQVTFSKKYHFNYPLAILGNVLVTDSCYYSTGVTLDTSSVFSIGNLFVKFDLEGNEIFNKPLFSDSKFYETWWGDLIKTNDGNLLTIGILTDTTRKGFMIKYNTAGDTLQTKEYFSPFYPDEPFITPIQVVEEPNGNITTYDAVAKEGADGDLCISRFDSNLNLMDQTTYGTAYKENVGRMMILEDDGGLILGAGRNNKNLSNNNLWSRSLVFKTDTAGTVEWEYLSPASYIQDRAYALLKTPDDGLIVGTSRGFEEYVNAGLGYLYWESAYFFKLDENQNVEWELEVFDSINPAPNPVNEINRIVPINGGGAFIAAGSFHMTRSLSPSNSGTFGWFFKATNGGELEWVRKYKVIDSGLYFSHRFYDLKPTPDGGVIAAGEATGPNIPGERSQFGWLIKLDSFGCLIPGCQVNDTITATLDQPVASPPALAIYPNPARDYLNFQLRPHRPLRQAHFRIVDASGRVVQEIESDLPLETHIVPVWEWGAGVYFLQYVEGGEVRVSERFVVLE